MRDAARHVVSGAVARWDRTSRALGVICVMAGASKSGAFTGPLSSWWAGPSAFRRAGSARSKRQGRGCSGPSSRASWRAEEDLQIRPAMTLQISMDRTGRNGPTGPFPIHGDHTGPLKGATERGSRWAHVVPGARGRYRPVGRPIAWIERAVTQDGAGQPVPPPPDDHAARDH